MPAADADRPDPDRLLAHAATVEARQRRGRLKVFLGACPGVGKTYAMLTEARRLRARGTDLVVGVVETHGRAETAALLEGLERLPRRTIEYRGARLDEFDVAAALVRRPAVVVVDELAHTNAPGSRFEKRWQDVRALLDARIDVMTTMNVQHVESLNDVVARITGVQVRETVPDAVLAEADEVAVVDLSPAAVLERLRDGKVYVPETAQAAITSFFQPGNLAALRELVLRKTAELVDRRRREDRHTGGTPRLRSALERVLVCVGPSPLSARLVRAAHRSTAVVRGELFALHVAHAGRPLAPSAHARVLQHLQLAESLGARSIVLESPHPAAAIVDFARAHDISRIVIGKTHDTRRRELLFGSFTMDVIRNSGSIDVHVIHDHEAADGEATADRPPIERRGGRRWLTLLAGSAGAAAATTLAWLVYWPPDLSVEAMVLLLGVVVVALRFGRGAAVVASLGCALGFNFLFIEPRFTFAVAEPSYLLALAAMLGVGLVVATLVAQVRDRATAARARETEVMALNSFVRELVTAATIDEVAKTTLAHLRDVVSGDLVFFVADVGVTLDATCLLAQHGDATWLDSATMAVAQWCWDHGRPAGLGTTHLPGIGALFVPMRSQRGKEGVLGVHPDRADLAPDAKQRLLLDTFASHASAACERLAAAEERRAVQREADTERLRSNLLASVSHDLRTPLATITGAASSLLEHMPPGDARGELLAGIAGEARRLDLLIDNLVHATRLEGSQVQLRRQWTSIEELVGSAIRRATPQLGERAVATAIPADLPLVHADPVLLEQALFLLLDNAAQHTPPTARVTVAAHQIDREVVVEVADDGPGVPAELRARCFRRFERGHGSGGMGLGLSICAAILAAHGGSASLRSDAPSGACFVLRLPLPEQPPTIEPPTESDPT